MISPLRVAEGVGFLAFRFDVGEVSRTRSITCVVDDAATAALGSDHCDGRGCGADSRAAEAAVSAAGGRSHRAADARLQWNGVHAELRERGEQV